MPSFVENNLESVDLLCDCTKNASDTRLLPGKKRLGVKHVPSQGI